MDGAVSGFAIAALASSPPIDIDRADAARQARDELSKSLYLENEPGFLQRAVDWVVEQIGNFLGATSAVVPGGITGVFAILILIVVGVAVLRFRGGLFVRTAKTGGEELITDRTRTAADHRATAESAFDSGHLEEAIRERFRAIVRELEQRVLIDVRPGRTADEVAAEFSLVPLGPAARAFDEVSYGGRPGSIASYELVRAADDAIRGKVRA